MSKIPTHPCEIFVRQTPDPSENIVAKSRNSQRNFDVIILVPLLLCRRVNTLPQPNAIRVQIRISLEEMVQLRDILARHFCTFCVQGLENAGDGGVGELVAVWEQFAADYGVNVVSAVPEVPFPAEIGGRVD